MLVTRCLNQNSYSIWERHVHGSLKPTFPTKLKTVLSVRFQCAGQANEGFFYNSQVDETFRQLSNDIAGNLIHPF